MLKSQKILIREKERGDAPEKPTNRSIKYGKISPRSIAADFVDLPAAVSFSD
jgi:hypothetical protein